MGFDWPLSPLWLFSLLVLVTIALWIHGRALLKSTLIGLAWKLIVLRTLAAILFLILISRPFITTEEPDTSRMKLLVLSDLSGSMDARDDRNSPRRISQVQPFFSVHKQESWINRMREKYGKVDTMGFSDDLKRLNSKSWTETELGKKTALGDALHNSLSLELGERKTGAAVVFSDGLNNQGRSVLEVAKEYRAKAVPINVVGVGKEMLRGDLRVSFTDRRPVAVAKEELLMSAEVENLFDRSLSTELMFFIGDQLLDSIPLDLKKGEIRKIMLSPQLPKFAGPKRYRLSLKTPDGDSDPSNDSDSLLVLVKPPEQFTVLYLSNQVRPLYSFIKRVLGNEERFNLNSLIRLGENVFHAFGEKVKPNYPTDPNFWMDFDAILLDLDALSEMNASVVSSLKDFVQKRGGGLLTFGPLGDGRKKLGGLLPAKEVERILAKDNLSLKVYEEPLFTPKDKVQEMRPFIPDRLPGYFISEQNKGARGVVVSRANGKPVLTVQAYGAGKVAYWGVPDDWRRAISDEKGADEFRKFWQSLTQWLGEGGEERLKIHENEDVLPRGMDAVLKVEALSADFEPAMDAMVRADIEGPEGFAKTIQLYPQGAIAGQYSGSFQPNSPGAYEVKYRLDFPNGEELKTETYIRVSETGEESKDLSYAERELKMLAKLTGGQFLPIAEMNEAWEPTFAKSIPTLLQRASLAEVWPIFILIFLAGGFEWIIRRQAGLK